MKFVFEEFVAENKRMPDGAVGIKIREATEAADETGEVVPVATGNEFVLRVTPEVALEWAFELAIEAGFMEDQEKPKIADLAEMRKAIEEQRKGRDN